MMDTAQVTCRLSKGPCMHKETWWWNEEVAEAVREKKKKYRNWKPVFRRHYIWLALFRRVRYIQIIQALIFRRWYFDGVTFQRCSISQRQLSVECTPQEGVLLPSRNANSSSSSFSVSHLV